MNFFSCSFTEERHTNNVQGSVQLFRDLVASMAVSNFDFPLEGKYYSVSVLVISVGKYTGFDGAKSFFENLEGLEGSAFRVANAWISAGKDGRLGHRGLRSVRILASSTSPDLQFDGNPVPPATSTNVTAAFKDWLAELDDPNTLGVLHWLGHGVLPHEYGNSPGAFLVCEDATEAGQRAFDFPEFFEKASIGEIPNNVVFFLDSCRQVDSDHSVQLDSFDPSGGLEFLSGPFDDRPHVVHLKLPGSKAWTAAANMSSDLGFRGGAVATEAIVDSMEKFGGARATGSSRYKVTVDSVVEGANCRISWWRSLIPSSQIPVLAFHAMQGNGTPVFLMLESQPSILLEGEVFHGGSPISASDEPNISVLVGANDNCCQHHLTGLPHTPPRPMSYLHKMWRAEIPLGSHCMFRRSQFAVHSSHQFTSPGRRHHVICCDAYGNPQLSSATSWSIK